MAGELPPDLLRDWELVDTTPSINKFRCRHCRQERKSKRQTGRALMKHFSALTKHARQCRRVEDPTHNVQQEELLFVTDVSSAHLPTDDPSSDRSLPPETFIPSQEQLFTTAMSPAQQGSDEVVSPAGTPHSISGTSRQQPLSQIPQSEPQPPPVLQSGQVIQYASPIMAEYGGTYQQPEPHPATAPTGQDTVVVNLADLFETAAEAQHDIRLQSPSVGMSGMSSPSNTPMQQSPAATPGSDFGREFTWTSTSYISPAQQQGHQQNTPSPSNQEQISPQPVFDQQQIQQQIERLYQLPAEQEAEAQAPPEAPNLVELDPMDREKVSKYKAMLNQPVDGRRPNGVSTATAIATFMHLRHKYKFQNIAVEELQQFMSKILLCDDANVPAGQEVEPSHNFPPTRYLMEKIVGVEHRQKIEYHACPCGTFAWPPYHRDYKYLKEQLCPNCGRHRVVQDNQSGSWYAPKPFWYFGVEETISKYFMSNNDWSEYRATPEARNNSFYTSAVADDLRNSDECGAGFLDHVDNSAYSIGVDWFQPFTWKTHSVGLVTLKCLDFEDRYQGIAQNVFPLMIISGPNEPGCFNPYAKVIADDFAENGPGTDGFKVKSAHSGVQFHHRILLVAVYGDTPARTKVGKFVGHTADLACIWCLMNAVPCLGYPNKYWKGYHRPVPISLQKIRELPEGTTAKVGDENILCTKAEVESKGALYLAYQQTNPRYRGPNAFGAVGRCLMDSVLSYFDMYNMFVVPPAHSLGRGVGLDLWSYLFNPLKYKPTAPSRRFHKPAQRRNVTARGGRAQPGRQARGRGRSTGEGRFRRGGRRNRGRGRGRGQRGRYTAQHATDYSSDTDEGEPIRAPSDAEASDISRDDDPEGGDVADEAGRLPNQVQITGRRRNHRERVGIQQPAHRVADQPVETPNSVQMREEWQQNKPDDLDTRVWYNGDIIGKNDKKLMKARAAKIVRNCDQDSPYVDIVKKEGKLSTVDQFITFFDAYAPLIMRGITLAQSPAYTKVVMNVHAACVFFCRHYVPVAGETYEQTCDRHVGYLRAYGEFIESNGLPDKLLKFNLHMVCCRLKAQCMARGHVGAENELFIERAILAIKYYIRGKINQWPEKVMINGLLRKLAIDGFQRDRETQMFNELTNRGQARELYGLQSANAAYDDPPEQDYYIGSTTGHVAGDRYNYWVGHKEQHRFIGWGQKLYSIANSKLDQADKDKLVKMLCDRITWEHTHRALTGVDISPQLVQQLIDLLQSANSDPGIIRLHDTLLKGMRETIHSVGKARQPRRESFWVLLRTKLYYVEEFQVVVAKIHRYAYCTIPSGANVDPRVSQNEGRPYPYRAAFVTALSTTRVVDNNNILYKVNCAQPIRLDGPPPITVRASGREGDTDFTNVQVVNIDDIQCKVMYCKDDDPNSSIIWCRQAGKSSGAGWG